MHETEARRWLVEQLDVPRETIAGLDRFVELLSLESARQNLVSRNSLEQIWSRHILDSAQLLSLAADPVGSWLDLGTGAGFPGLIVAALRPGPVTLVESRRLRVEFLRHAATVLAIEPTIICAPIERVETLRFDVISARAFAPLDRLFTLAERFATANTRWVLPKGKNAQSELEAVESLWQGEFRLEPSVTDPEARIIVAKQVSRRHEGRRGR